MVKVGVAPSTDPVSEGAMGVSEVGGAGMTMGSRFGGAAGWCAQAAINRVQPRKNGRLIGVMSFPLAELILPGA
jgi:hypothetical protein